MFYPTPKSMYALSENLSVASQAVLQSNFSLYFNLANIHAMSTSKNHIHSFAALVLVLQNLQPDLYVFQSKGHEIACWVRMPCPMR